MSNTKIQGLVVAHHPGKKFTIIQIRDGAKVQSFFMRDADLCYCEAIEPRPGMVVRFEISPKKPQNSTDFPIAVRGEVYASIESLARVDASFALLAASKAVQS